MGSWFRAWNNWNPPLYITAEPRGPLRVRQQANVSLNLSGDLEGVNCFFDGEAVKIHKGNIAHLGPFEKRRTKLNCTKAVGHGVFKWWSYLNSK